MPTERGTCPCAVIGGSTLYAFGTQVNTNEIDLIQLKQESPSELTWTSWSSLNMNIDSAPNFACRIGPPKSKKLLVLSNFYWYIYDFAKDQNYHGWGSAQPI